jgi:hypothetical protein
MKFKKWNGLSIPKKIPAEIPLAGFNYYSGVFTLFFYSGKNSPISKESK